MIEEIGKVVAVEGNQIWVETQVKTTCTSCKASESCPTSTIAKAFSPKPEHILITAPSPLVVGQQVKIGISEKALLYASLMVYIIPLVAMMLSAAGTMMIFPNIHELLALAVSSLAALAGFWWASAYSKRPANRHRFTPIFLGATQQDVVTYKHEIPVHKIV